MCLLPAVPADFICICDLYGSSLFQMLLHAEQKPVTGCCQEEPLCLLCSLGWLVLLCKPPYRSGAKVNQRHSHTDSDSWPRSSAYVIVQALLLWQPQFCEKEDKVDIYKLFILTFIYLRPAFSLNTVPRGNCQLQFFSRKKIFFLLY